MDYETYWNMVIGATRTAVDVVREHDIGPGEVMEWLQVAEAEAMKVAGLELWPSSWLTHNETALAELQEAVELVENETRDPPEVAPSSRAALPFVVTHILKAMDREVEVHLDLAVTGLCRTREEWPTCAAPVWGYTRVEGLTYAGGKVPLPWSIRQVHAVTVSFRMGILLTAIDSLGEPTVPVEAPPAVERVRAALRRAPPKPLGAEADVDHDDLVAALVWYESAVFAHRNPAWAAATGPGRLVLKWPELPATVVREAAKLLGAHTDR